MKKYIVILFDGMADYPDSAGNTPMKEACKPVTDALAAAGETGLCRTVPAGMKPGSDVANLSVMGYDPAVYYTGRSPLEALSIGAAMSEADVSYRCNLVTLSESNDFEKRIMLDYSAGEIKSEEASELIAYLTENLSADGARLYAGVSYRHCLILKNGETGAELTPPHDITGKAVGPYLPKGANSVLLNEITKRSIELLKNHPVNAERIKRGQKPANSVWFWGEGRKPALKSFYSLHGKKGAVISAVDLLKGIAKAADLQAPDVPGATGTINSNFDSKAEAAIKALTANDFVYVHLEAPDECGHQGDYDGKRRSIELIDRKIVAPIVDYLRENDIPFRLAVLPDHATPVSLKTHTSDPVPYLIYDSEQSRPGPDAFNEETAKNTGNFLESGTELLKKLLCE